MADYPDISDPTSSSPVFTPGENSVQSSKFVKKFSSKVLGNHGQQLKQSIKPPEALEKAGGGLDTARGMGFSGSMPGEIMMSHSTSTMALPKRHSISATADKYEDLVAKAGIDVHISEVNIEDLIMYHGMEGEPGYDFDGDTDSGDDNAGDNFDDDTIAADQKLAHKERSIMQMVGVLSDRMAGLNAVVVNRFSGCKADLDETTHFRSSCTKKIALFSDEEDWNVASPNKASEKVKRGWNASSPGDGSSDVAAGVGIARTTFRNAPQSDAGRRLAQRFDQEYGSKQASNATLKFSKTSSSKAKLRVHHFNKRNAETRKRERLDLECKLHANMDQYLTRSVIELVYSVPDDISEGIEGDPVSESNEAPQQDAAPIIEDGRSDGSRAQVSCEAMERERFPIPLESNEMNPKLLLAYACERAAFSGRARMFKCFTTSAESQDLFVYMFWFIHCNVFQEDSQREQTHLLHCAASRYVGVLRTEGMGMYKDFFFKYYPFLIANAVFWGFHYLCPGSRNLYSNTFRRVLYLQCSRILCGMEVNPLSIVEIRTKLFPDETAEATDEREFRYQPHHLHSPGMRSMNVEPAGLSTTTGFSSLSEACGVRVGDRSEVFTGAVSGVGALGGAGSNVAKAGSSAGRKECGQKEENGSSKGETVVIQGMLKTFRPNPLEPYTVNWSALRFKPRRLEDPEKLKPRQQRTVFDASQISPMLQEHLKQNSSSAGRRRQNMVRTVPVAWCETGGIETYRRCPLRKELYDLIKSEHVKAKREFVRAKVRAAGVMQRALRHVEADRQSISTKGSRKVRLKSMDIVTELQKRGPWKGTARRTER